MKAAANPTQSKITSFFQIVDKMEKLVEQNPEMKELMRVAQCQRREREIESICPLLKQLLVNAERNAQMLPQQRRHEQVMKKFATSLFIYSGPMAYEFLHTNLPNAIPSLRTVQRIVSNEYQPLHEGEFRFNALLLHLQTYNATKIITVGEDATRVITRVDYDNETNRLVGFVLSCDEEGLPLCDSFLAVSFEAIEESFKTADTAKYAFVYMAQALGKAVPGFCLACHRRRKQI